MRLLGFLILVTGLLLSSCSERPAKKPAYLLNEEKMVALMVDMHLIETAQNLKLLSPDSVNAYAQMFESIYLSHSTSKSDFDSSLFYYSTQTDQMNVIYDQVLERLYEMEAEVKANE